MVPRCTYDDSVIVQTTWKRIIPDSYKDRHENAYAHVSAYLDNCDRGIGKNGYFIQSGGYSYDHVLYDVVDIFDITIPKSFISSLEYYGLLLYKRHKKNVKV